MRSMVLALFLATITCIAGCGLSLQNTVGLFDTGSTYRITAVFSAAANLEPGEDVQLGQSVVGRVTEIRTENFRAHVDLDIDADVDLPKNTRARLELTSALGNEYVLLEIPGEQQHTDTLEDRATIPVDRTSRGPDVEHTLAVMGNLLQGSGIEHVRTIITETNTALGGRTGEAKRLLHDLDSVLGTLHNRSDEITGIVDSMHTLSQDLGDSTPVLEEALTDIRPALDVLLDERDRFTDLFDKIESVGTTTQGLLDKTGTALTEHLDQLRPVLRTLESLDDDLGTTLTELTDFSQLLQDVAPGDYLNLDGTVNVPLTVSELLAPNGFSAGNTSDPDPPQPGDVGDLLGGGVE